MSVTYTDQEVHFSVTELQDADRCLRSWDYQSPNRQSLQLRGAPRTELHVGTAMHFALEAAALGFDPQLAARAFFWHESRRIGAEYVERTNSTLSVEERQQLDKSYGLVSALVEQYFRRYDVKDPIAPFKLLVPEVSFRVPIPLEHYIDGHPEFPRKYHGPRLLLVGTIDGLGVEAKELPAQPELGGLLSMAWTMWDTDKVWLIEHKTYSQKPQRRDYELDRQLTGYAWAAEQLFGTPVQGALYDGINKKLPRIPALLKDMSVSREAIDTTVDTYVGKLVEVYGPGWMEMEVRYVGEGKAKRPVTGMEWYGDVIRRLEAIEKEPQTPFHTRWKIPFSRAQVVDFEVNLVKQALVLANPGLMIWPNRPWTGCWDCGVCDLCDAQTRGEDVEFLRKARYRVGTYGTRLAQRDLTPEEVGSLGEVERLVLAKRDEFARKLEMED